MPVARQPHPGTCPDTCRSSKEAILICTCTGFISSPLLLLLHKSWLVLLANTANMTHDTSWCMLCAVFNSRASSSKCRGASPWRVGMGGERCWHPAASCCAHARTSPTQSTALSTGTQVGSCTSIQHPQELKLGSGCLLSCEARSGRAPVLSWFSPAASGKSGARMEFSWGSGGGLPHPDPALNLLGDHLFADLDDKTLQVRRNEGKPNRPGTCCSAGCPAP